MVISKHRGILGNGTEIESYYSLKKFPKRYLAEPNVKDAIDFHVKNNMIKGIRTVTIRYDDGTAEVAFYIVEKETNDQKEKTLLRT